MSKKKRISVLDFRPEDCAHTVSVIEAYYRKKGVPVEVVPFTTTVPFVLDFKERQNGETAYDMVFVGADSMNGADSARQIRGYGPQIPLFLVSEVSDFAVEGFHLMALDYLVKPVSPKRLAEALAKIGSQSLPIPETL